MTTLGTAVLKIDVDESGVDRGLSSIKGKAEATGHTMSTALGSATGFVTAQVGMKAMNEGFDFLIGNAANFEQSLGAVQSSTGATSEEMEKMRSLALKIGADTSKSASEAVLAMGELAKAGMPVEEILNGAGLAAVQLAESTGIAVPTAAVLMSNALNTFQADGLSASEAAEVFAKAANASAIGVEDLGMSLSAVGPVAAASGVSMNEFATVMGLFGNNAMRGSDAGTSFKAFLAGLTPTTDKAKDAMKAMGFSAFDAQGNFKDMRTITKELGEAMAGMTEEQKATTGELIFGSDGVRGMNILLKEGVGGWDDFTGAMEKAPDLAEQSAMRMKGLNGSIEILKGSIETVSIVFGTIFLGALAAGVTAITGVVNAIIPLVNAFLGLGPVQAALSALGTAFDALPAPEIMAGLAAAMAVIFGPLIIAGIIAVTVAVWGFVAAQIAAIAAMTILGAPVLLVAAAIALLVVGILLAIKHWEQIKEVMTSVGNAIVTEVTASWNHLRQVVTDAVNSVLAFIQAHWQTILAIVGGPLAALVILVAKHWSDIEAGVSSAWEAIKSAITTAVETVTSALSSAWDTIETTARTAWDAVSTAVTSVLDSVNTAIDEKVAAWKEKFEDFKGALGKVWDGIKDGVGRAWYTIWEMLRSAINGIIDLINSFISAAVSGWNALADADPTGAIPNVHVNPIGHLASGGRAYSGMPYVVGEQGWELFMPDRSGTVLNHEDSVAAMGGAGGMVHLVIELDGRVLHESEQQYQGRELRLAARGIR